MNNIDTLIERQAHNTWQALYVGLGNEGIQFGRDYTDVDVVNSVRLITYSLRMTNVSNWDKFRMLTDKMTQAAQLDKKAKVRLDYSGLNYRIEVPKPKHLHGTPDIREIFNSAKGLNVSVGVSAYSNKPSTVDFAGTLAGHMLISGTTRCGKTNVLKLILLCLIYKNTPDTMRIAVIDTKKAKGKYPAIVNSSHLATEVLNTEQKALTFLEWVKLTLDRLEGRSYDKKVIIVIDEVYLLMKNAQIKELLAYIASVGAESGFHIIAATQYTKVDDIGGKQFKGNLMTRIAGKTDDHYGSANATGKEGAGAEYLTKPGDFLLVNDDDIERIAVPEVFDNYFNKIERGMSPIMKLNWTDTEVSSAGVATVRAPNIAACFDKIDHRLLQLAIEGRHNGNFLGPDKIRQFSKVLEKRGLGNSIGQTTANHYVKFAKKYRSVK